MKDTIPTAKTASRPAGPAARGGRPRRRKLTFDRVTFFLAFLGVPLAIFVIFVLIPFGQAIFWAMTDWRGFSPDYNFVGLDNFTKMFQDDIFLKALRNVALLAVFVPLVTLTLALGVAVAITLGDPARAPSGDPRSVVLPDRLVLPLRRAGDHRRSDLGADVRPERRPAQRRPHGPRPRPVRHVRVAGREGDGDAGP